MGIPNLPLCWDIRGQLKPLRDNQEALLKGVATNSGITSTSGSWKICMNDVCTTITLCFDLKEISILLLSS